MNKIIIILICFVSGLLGLTVSWIQHQNDVSFSSSSDQRDLERIPTYHYPTTFVKQLAGDPAAGKKIFKQYCVSCHGNPPLIDVKAPHIGDSAAWARIKKSGMTKVMHKTLSGVGAMPARGGCFECSDEQLSKTVEYILNNSRHSSPIKH